jgi:hypothetical protein
MAVLVVSTFPVESQAGPNSRLRHDYAFKRFRSCIQNPDGFTGDLRLASPQNGSFRAGAATGIRSYNGDGTGTVTLVNVNTFAALDGGFPSTTAASQSETTCDILYNAAADGSFSESLTCTGTVIAGTNPGLAFRITNIQIDGQLGVGGNIIILSDNSPNVEHLERHRICARSGTAVKVQ